MRITQIRVLEERAFRNHHSIVYNYTYHKYY